MNNNNVIAHLNMLRIAPRKVRLVINLIRNKNVKDAIILLDNINKSSSVYIKKLIKSVIANAVNNKYLDADNLFIKEIFVNEGSTMKRFRPRARGRSNKILKRTSNITIIVSDKNIKIINSKKEKEKELISIDGPKSKS